MIGAALARLEAMADPGKAAEAAAYHKAPRRYLGVPVPRIEELVGVASKGKPGGAGRTGGGVMGQRYP